MAVVGYVLAGLFTALWLTGAVALIWAMVFAIRMTFQFKQAGLAYSRATLWNPMNAVFRPDLLSEEGQKSRRFAIAGFVVFLAACACIGGLALTAKLWG
ncbi:hypothetical protein ACFFJT_20480 [Dyella flava]|uniref:Uncharacterized protein n=1 Tax=Dyella flava TaxID=1920170 RepID=A0ABS2K0B3_9GAMM|nr:hypothetical protein [Dyella flava]MBM7124687.1 hypothetical protein [Dyella flava]GLQ49340.1 hypothetical protein GCM10010872_07890 [Dyella flava]